MIPNPNHDPNPDHDPNPTMKILDRIIAPLAEASERDRSLLGIKCLLAPLVQLTALIPIDRLTPFSTALSKLAAGVSHGPAVEAVKAGVITTAAGILGRLDPLVNNGVVASLLSVISLSLVHVRAHDNTGKTCWAAGLEFVSSEPALACLVRSLLLYNREQCPTSAIGAAMVSQAVLEAWLPI